MKLWSCSHVRVFFSLLVSASVLQGCYFAGDSDDDKPKNQEGDALPGTTPTPSKPWEDWERQQQENDRRQAEQLRMCQARYEKFNVIKYPLPASSSPACKDCVPVPTLVNYMLPERLTDNFWVVIEAFDNPLFLGSPLVIKSEPGFKPQHAGDTKEVMLFLPVGQVYLRAYLTQQQTTVPYPYLGMQLVSNSPVGIYGMLSTPTQLTVVSQGNDPCPTPVKIYLDKLFKDPNSEPDTHAKLRIQLNIGPDIKVPDHRLVYVRLFDSPDFATRPVHEYQVASELFLIQDRLGKAELVTPNLEVGSYYVQTFVDENGNAFVDQAEAQGFISADGLPKAVPVAENRMGEISLTLTKPTL